MTAPEQLYDDAGYPTPDAIDALRRFEGTPRALAEYAATLCDGGFVTIEQGTSDTGQPVHRLQIDTAGWSGVESVVGALSGSLFSTTFFELRQRGGHHVWLVPDALWESADMHWGVRDAAPATTTSWLTREWQPRFERRLTRALAAAEYAPFAPIEGFPVWHRQKDLALRELSAGARIRRDSTLALRVRGVLAHTDDVDDQLRAQINARLRSDYVHPIAFWGIALGVLVLTTAATMSDWMPLKWAANTVLTAAVVAVAHLLLVRPRSTEALDRRHHRTSNSHPE